MTNLFIDAKQSSNNKYFTYNNLNGLNNRGSGSSKINIIGILDNFTVKTLYENYDIIAQNLKVYPTITIYSRGYELNGGFGGFYYPNNNHIDIIDNFYLVSMLAHEMRHAYQYIYFPDMYFNQSYRSVSGYLNSGTERDARNYALDYCIIREYGEEANYLKKDEEQIELVIQNKLHSSIRGLSDDYFIQNPHNAAIVPRTYHYDQSENSSSNEVAATSSSSDVESGTSAFGYLKALINLSVIIFFLYKIIMAL